MMYDDAINKAVDDWIKTERDAGLMRLLTSGTITGVSRLGDDWRVDIGWTFSVAPTIEAALLDVLKKAKQ